MGKQCVVVAVLFAVREDGNALCIRVGIATKQAGLWLNRLILYVREAFPESNRAGLIGEWTRKISIIARGRNDVALTVIGLAF